MTSTFNHFSFPTVEFQLFNAQLDKKNKKQEHACAYGNAGSYVQFLNHKTHLAW